MMTNLLIKLFIKNPEKVQDSDVRTSYGILAGAVGILCNVLLCIGKFLAGIFTQSIAVTADAFNNLSDAASNIISLVGMKMAAKPADEDHPFGHGRIEYIAALIVAFLVFQVGFTFLKNSIIKILYPEDTVFELVPFAILGISLLVKLWMGLFNRRIGRKINSNVLLAASTDSFGDILVTAATMVAILVEYFTGWKVDGFVGLFVSLVVLWAGIGIARDTLEPLIGQAADPELCEAVKTKVEEYDGIVGTHDLIIHSYGPNKHMASIHAEVPSDVNIEDSHEIIDMAEREISRDLGILLVIHMDPVEIHDEKLNTVREEIDAAIQDIDPEVSFHDFRMVQGKNQINLIFDIVVPYNYKKEKVTAILGSIRKKMKEIDRRFCCVITVDHDFTGKKAASS